MITPPPAPANAGPALNVGDGFTSAGRTIIEADVVSFACLSGDFNRIHIDAEYARSFPFGQRIAHGLLVLSVLSGLTTQSSGYHALEPHVIALKDLACRFAKPNFIGDTIHLQVTVVERKEGTKPDCAEVTFRREAINQRGEVAVQADFRMLMRVDA